MYFISPSEVQHAACDISTHLAWLPGTATIYLCMNGSPMGKEGVVWLPLSVALGLQKVKAVFLDSG